MPYGKTKNRVRPTFRCSACGAVMMSSKAAAKHVKRKHPAGKMQSGAHG